jgi:signal transduction histidine kinase
MTEKSFAETLRTSEAVRFLTDAFPARISLIDTEHRYQFVNKFYQECHDRSREEIEGHHVRDLYGDKGYEAIRPHLERTEAGERSMVEVHVNDMDHLSTLVPHYGPDGKVDGILVLSQDVTELRATRAALIQAEKMATIGRLVAGILHEINTPLGVLKANNATIAAAAEKACKSIVEAGTTDGAPATLKSLDGVASLTQVNVSAIDRLTDLLTSLKRFIHLDEASVQKAVLHENLDATIKLLQTDLDPSIHLVKRYGTIPPISCRPAELNQVFLTLLTNAAKRIKGEGTVTVRTSRGDGDVRVEITDTGVGIAPDDLESIFEPSFTEGTSRIQFSLGLFVSRSIVERHHGELLVTSKVGHGSCFTIILPN